MLRSQRIATNRDVLLIRVAPERIAVVACDSSGGVGPKEGDSVRVSGRVVGKYATRTVLMELSCAGATVAAVTVSMGVEYDPTGKQILSGCRASLAEIGSRAPVIWSSEKNFTVGATGLGVSAMGLARRRAMKIGGSRNGDEVALVGRPSVGRAVLEAERRRAIPSVADAARLMKSPRVHEVIPVGSTGVLHEAGVLAKDSGLRFEPSVPEAELKVSAGPSTALVVSLEAGSLARLEKRLDLPATTIGSLKNETQGD